eukprot:360719-Chlamydomonas_euryale.AAC.17
MEMRTNREGLALFDDLFWVSLVATGRKARRLLEKVPAASEAVVPARPESANWDQLAQLGV